MENPLTFTIYCVACLYVASRAIGARQNAGKQAEEKTESKPLEPEVKQDKKEKKSSKNPFIDDAMNALVSLGIKKTQANKMVMTAVGSDTEMSLDDIIKKAISSNKQK